MLKFVPKQLRATSIRGANVKPELSVVRRRTYSIPRVARTTVHLKTPHGFLPAVSPTYKVLDSRHAFFMNQKCSFAASVASDIDVVTTFDPIEAHLSKHKDMIDSLDKGDFRGYRGHIYRVFNFAVYILTNHCRVTLTDRDKELIGVALVYHDIGLWSDRELAYIDPSVEFLNKCVGGEGSQYTQIEMKLMQDIIRYHHKITGYNPSDGKELDAKYEQGGGGKDKFVVIVDSVKNADLVDFSKGKIKKGISKNIIQKVLNTIPNDGFHDTLNAMGGRFHGNNFFKVFREISKIYYW